MRHLISTLLLGVVTVASAVDPIPAKSKSAPGYLGVVVVPLEDDLFRAHVKVPDKTGLVVLFVQPRSPAEKAGLKVNDVLLKMEDTALKTPVQLGQLVSGKAPGEKVQFEVVSSGKRKTVTATLIEKPRKTVALDQGQGAVSSLVDIDPKLLNDIYNDSRLSNEQKNAKIHELFTSKHFPSVQIKISGKRVDVMPQAAASDEDLKEALDELSEKLRDMIEKSVKDSKEDGAVGITIKIIPNGGNPIILHESTRAAKPKPKDAPTDKK